MSDLDGAYGQSPLATLNPAYSQPRMQSMNQITGTRRPSRASYKPANPPPNIALPATPSFSTNQSSSLQHPPQSLKPLHHASTAAQRGPSPIAAHPYSAQSLASTPDLEHDISDDYYHPTDLAHHAHYRSYANNDSVDMAIPSQPAAFAADSRQSSSSALNAPSYPGGPPSPALPRDRSPAVSPGSYFAAYPPASGVSFRERSGSANSTSSVEILAQAAPLLPHQAQSSNQTSHRTSPSMASSVPASESSQRGKRASSSRSHPHKSRPSTRKALTAALELAKVAVQLDGTSDDPHGAVKAYAKSVRLLREVMERVMRGEDSPSTSSSTRAGEADDQRPIGRRRSVVAKEEEVRRLKAIHDTYADRMKILCLIYSISDPLSTPTEDHLSKTPEAEEPVSGPSSSVPQPALPPQSEQVDATATLPASVHPVSNGPYDVETDEGSEVDLDAVTIRRHQEQATPTPESEWEGDSEVERRGLSQDRLHADDREPEGTLLAYNLPSPQEDIRHEDTGTLSGNDTSLIPPAGTAAKVAVGDAPLPSSGPPVVHVTVGGRTSILPPPRPPPTGPLPTRPRLPSGTVVPAQLLNQPLPPLPPQQPSEPASHPIHPQHQPTLTRQSSASSVSAVSGVSSVASGSSAASNAHQTTPAAQVGPAASLAAPNAFGGRPRGNSNAHGRTQSNADRLVVVNEEREEEETGPTIPAKDAQPASPPQEYRYRSRSSSMVSLKDRDRAKAQVLGANGLVPPVPTLSASSSPSATPTVPANHVASKPSTVDQFTVSNPSASSPDLTSFGPRVTPRARGSSIGSAVTHSSEDIATNTVPVPAIPYTAGAPPPLSGPIVIPGAMGSGAEGPVKISPTPTSGTISQRRIKNATTGSTPPPAPSSGTSSALGKLTSAILPAATATSLGLTGRNRAASNPGKWTPGLFNVAVGEAAARAPGPAPPMSAGGRRQFPGNGKYQSFGVPSANASTASLVAGGSGTGTPTPSVAVAGLPASSLPPSPPSLSVLRPYFLMALLRRSMVDRSGGYVTPRLHIPHEVWTQGSAKLTNMPEKIKVIDVLASALEDLTSASLDFCGASSAIAASTGGADGNRKQAERWASKLEEFDRTFSQLAETFGKKLGVGTGFVVKKSVGMAAWGNKFLDRISTAGKQYDSPIAHANLLTRFLTQVQLLDEHTRALHTSPQPPCYNSLPQDVRSRIEVALSDISELFAKVVLTFVFRDLSVMLDKYHKTCDRWIQSNPGNPP
ncbi:hypothetical protein PIIN_04912 [Serendipita indica DSM 11827]|uniref:MIT domain-containing protein n=1 Tax=Serendipita indica (strain DSM 11827) TaxID=1109443 RepID=G4TI33_SERID|nr:hypothetical protein PIIN_04912 [Serendipita indica DSM 11827]